MNYPTLQQAQAALAAAQAALDAATAAMTKAAVKTDEARRAFYRARREVEAARERDAKNAVARDRRKAQALAAEYGISIERESFPDGSIWWVLGPEDVYGGGDGVPRDDGTPVRADPCEGEHSCTDWSGVLDNVEHYVADLKAWNDETAAKLAKA